jgi:uncharacterized OB-fold protein
MWARKMRGAPRERKAAAGDTMRAAVTTTPAPGFRVLPLVTDANRHFWTGGEHGELRFLRCRACRYWIHPPQPICPACLGRELDVEAASGRATVATYTVNHQRWIPGFEPPYVVAIVELPEQAGLRLTTNLVNCGADDVAIGMSVRVVFEHRDDVWLPLFEPAP